MLSRHMRRAIAIAAGIGSASLLLGSPVASATQDDALVIKVTATEIWSRVEPKPPSGLAGNVITGSDRLRNAVAQFGKARGAVVGRDTYRIAFDTATAGPITVKAFLPGGTIRCAGTYSARRSVVVIRVAGGTGDFAGATGTCEARPAGTATLNVYRLKIPG